jgi:exonuclease SbcC
MITRLAVKNFRRVADMELVLGPDDHLIAIEGQNGSGKSSLVEALSWALTGESRYGRKGFDSMVRKGAELEGCEVVVEFDHAGAHWRTERSRVDHVTRAVLSCDGQAVCDTPSTVDAELARLLGMDAAGFRLAVLARQRDLSGLTSMSARARKASLARLLGVEAIARAAGHAHEEMSRSNEVVTGMGPQPDLDTAKLLVIEEQNIAALVMQEQSEAAAAVLALNVEISQTEPAEAAWQAATEAVSRSAGRLSLAGEACESAASAQREAVAALEAVGPVPVTRDTDIVLDELRRVEALEAALAHAVAIEAERAATSQDLADAQRELAVAERRALELSAAVAETSGPQRSEIILAGKAARASLDGATLRAATAHARAGTHRDALASLAELGSTCQACGQEVDEAHRGELVAAASKSAAAFEAEEQTAAGEAEIANTELLQAQEDLRACDGRAQSAATAAEELTRVAAGCESLRKRIQTYQARLARPVTRPDVDAADLTLRVVNLNAELDEARLARKLAAARAEATTQLATAQAHHSKQEQLLADAQAEAERCTVGGELEQAHERYLAAVCERDAEATLAGLLAERCSAAEDRVRAAGDALADLEVFSQRWVLQRRNARVAAHTKSLLWEVHDELSAGLRPALESAVTGMVTRLSDSRFCEVRISASYEVTVKDRTAWRPLSELSGGEQDLVALAVRLGLSQVVSERALGAAPSLLILDEVFGSQDGLRRETIMSSLRELRTDWSQVWLISHVGGLADVADRVVELSVVPDPDIAGEVRSDITIL